MRRLPILMMLWMVATGSLAAQDLSGTWKGTLEVSGTQLEVFFNLTKTDDAYSGTMDVPMQGAKDLPLDKVEVTGNGVTLGFSAAGITYEGEYQAGKGIVGTFNQGPMSESMNLTREESGSVAMNRPQEPKGPFPYTSEEVTFRNETEGITLAGTLTLPEGGTPTAAAILISGSGPQNRDEELLGHKPFWVLADHLTRNGIAVLRYDDRGVGQSTGEFSGATSEDFAGDVAAAMAYLQARPEVKADQIGLIGHSEGGLIAPLVAAQYDGVSFIVSMAGPGVNGEEIILAQQRLINQAGGTSQSVLDANEEFQRTAISIVLENEDEEEGLSRLIAYAEAAKEKYRHLGGFPELDAREVAETTFQQYNSDWFRYFLVHNPATTWEQVQSPVLSLIGEKDLQVPAEMNTTAITAALEKAGNPDFETVILPELNHLFQECETGSPVEYAMIEQTLSPTALDAITEWILERMD